MEFYILSAIGLMAACRSTGLHCLPFSQLSFFIRHFFLYLSMHNAMEFQKNCLTETLLLRHHNIFLIDDLRSMGKPQFFRLAHSTRGNNFCDNQFTSLMMKPS